MPFFQTCPRARHGRVGLGLTRMSDIFLSYATEDWAASVKLAAFFKEQSWTVSWHTYIPGRVYAPDVVEQLERAKVVVVLWSRSTSKSALRDVLKRAEQLLLIPVLLDEVRLPPDLGFLRSFNLSDWDGSALHAGLMSLLRHIGALIATSPPKAGPPASFEDISLSEIQENARRAIKESAAALPKDDARFKGVFISYRRNEAAAYARGLYDRLAAHFGKEKVFLDMENVGWGEDFVEAITSAAESCAVMIALISPRWTRGAGSQTELDDYVRLEVATALGRKIRVIPILIQGASMPAPKDLPEDLAPLVRRNALALSDTRWERDVEDLIKTLENLLNN
jgi:hypothetical protein